MTSKAASPRLLLLLFVLAGVAGMHTIGHPVDVAHEALGHATATMSAGMAAVEQETAAPPMAQHADEHDQRMVMNPLNVCVAVLVGGILLLLGVMVCRARHPGRVDHHIMTLSGRAGRGPPGLISFGLTIADLSVQRT